MPPLQCMGRRWRTGSDDFVLSGVLFGLFQAAMGVASAVIVGWRNEKVCWIDVGAMLAGNADSGNVSSETVSPDGVDDDAITLIRIQSGAYLFSGIAMFLLALMSSRGRIMEPSKRATTVPIMLYLAFLGLTAVATMSVVLAVFIYSSSLDKLAPCRLDYSHHGGRTWAMVHGQCIAGFIPFCLFAFLFFAAYDPTGRKTFSEHNAHSYTDLWDKRFGWLVCRCFRKDAASREAFRDIAAAFTNVFQGVDLVPSDIAAGMVLVHGHQQRVLAEGVVGKTFPSPNRSNNSVACSCCCSVEERVSRQSRPFSPITSALQRDVELLHRYRRFFMAAYGWALAIFKDPTEAVPMILCNLCFYCKKPSWAPHAHGEMCMCDSNILLRVGMLNEEDVIVTDFRNGLYQSPHFVVIDQSPDMPSEKAVVVGIRGSMSIDDALTDMAALPAPLKLTSETFAAMGPCYVHGGMLRTTDNILTQLEKSGVIQSLLDGPYKDLKLVLVGHSLGAGTVVILSLLIHDRYPALKARLRCIAYAPPGGLVSKNLSDYVASYVVSGFFGVDVVPRLAMHTIEDLRTSIIDAVCASQNSKASVFCSVLNPTRTKLLSADDAPTPEVVRARDKLLKSGVDPVVLQKASAITSMSAFETVVSPPSAAEAPIRNQNIRPSEATPLTPTNYLQHNSDANNLDYSASSAASPISMTALPLPNSAEEGLTPHMAYRTVKLYPPGRMVHFVKAVTRDVNCLFGAWTWKRQEYYVPTHISAENVQEIVCCPRMVTDHFPNNLYNVLENCYVHLGGGALDVFFEGATDSGENADGEGGFSGIRIARDVSASVSVQPPLPNQSGSAHQGVSSVSIPAGPPYAGGLKSISYRFPSESGYCSAATGAASIAHRRSTSNSAVVQQQQPQSSSHSPFQAVGTSAPTPTSSTTMGSADGGYAQFPDEARRRQ